MDSEKYKTNYYKYYKFEKKSKIINGKNPLAKDEDIVNLLFKAKYYYF